MIPLEIRKRCLAHTLRSELHVTAVGGRQFAVGKGISDAIVSTSRLILLLKGSVRYTVEGISFEINAGTQFIVPAWSRREWKVSSDVPCELLWCEFDDESAESAQHLCGFRYLSGSELSVEDEAYRRLLLIWDHRAEQGPQQSDLSMLHLESELKALLSRFWLKASQLQFLVEDQLVTTHPEIRQALRFLEKHYAQPDVLGKLYKGSEYTPNYLRKLFQEEISCSPGEYLKRVRMRQARYLLHTTSLQIKRIAVEVGYVDSLYFSRLYRQFWQICPRQERRD